MPNRDQARPRLGLRRVILIGSAAALGVAAVCLVVFGTTQKQLQVGVLLGLWGGLIAAFLTFGARRGQLEQAERLVEAESRVSQLQDARLQVSELQRQLEAAVQQARLSQEVELRRTGDVELSREVAARREADHRLEISLRREIEHLMSEHIGTLRSEVAALRAEVVDKLGGQLRLERIETTRVIGSDLEALQHEIRRLASNQQDDLDPSRSRQPQASAPSRVDSSVAGAARWRIEQPADIVDAEVIEGGQPARNEVNPAVHRYEDRYHSGRPDPVWSEPPAASREPMTAFGEPRSGQLAQAGQLDPVDQGVPTAQQPWSTAAATPTDPPSEPLDRPNEQLHQPGLPTPFSSVDPFAGLPRLSPLPADIELIPDVGSGARPPSGGASAEDSQGGDEPDRPGRRRAPEDDDEHDRYHGRRRAEAMADSMAAGPGPDGPGRRRAPDDDLARLPDR
jgi:hypothetical protein